MAGSWTAQPSTVTLLDATVTKLGPGVTLTVPVTGSVATSNSAAGVTAGTIESSALSRNYVAEALYLEIISPVDSSGTYPDATISFLNGTTDLKKLAVFDASYTGNMMPRMTLTEGRRQIFLGISTRDALRAVANGEMSPANLALKTTGWKITNSLSLKVESNAGWAQTAAAVVPLRVIVKGQMLTEADLVGLQAAWAAARNININKAPGIRYSAVHSGVPTASGWASMPGGNAQTGAIQVNRRINFAYNASATSTSQNYYFTQSNSLGGSLSQVATPENDLGDDFVTNHNVFILEELGLRIPSDTQVYFGFKIGGQIIPQDTPQGTPISTNTNDLQYGNAQPQLTSSGRFYALPSAKRLLDLVVYQQQAVPFVSTVGLTSIAANGVSVAKGGVLIEQA